MLEIILDVNFASQKKVRLLFYSTCTFMPQESYFLSKVRFDSLLF